MKAKSSNKETGTTLTQVSQNWFAPYIRRVLSDDLDYSTEAEDAQAREKEDMVMFAAAVGRVKRINRRLQKH